MRLAFASDHAGFELKLQLLELLAAQHDLIDLGTDSTEPVDYPDFAAKLGEFIRDGRAERGILVCGSGAGAAIAANKLIGIRAALAHDCCLQDDRGWSIYGAERAQPVATGGKCKGSENG